MVPQNTKHLTESVALCCATVMTELIPVLEQEKEGNLSPIVVLIVFHSNSCSYICTSA